MHPRRAAWRGPAAGKAAINSGNPGAGGAGAAAIRYSRLAAMPLAPNGSPFTRARKLTLAITALAYAAAAAALYGAIDDHALRATLSLPMSLLAALLGLSLASYALRAWRWIHLTGSLGLRVPPVDNLVYYLAGYSLTPTPGKAGEAIRLWLLKRAHAVPISRTLPIMLADIVVDLWAVLLLAAACMSGFAQYRWYGVALGALVLALSVPILFPRRFRPLLNAGYRAVPRAGRALARIRQLMNAMGELSGWRTYGLTLLPTLAAWLALGAAFHLLLEHLGTGVGFASAVFVFSFSTLVGSASMLPGGLGSTEASLVLLLRFLGVDLGTAIAATAIIRLTTLWFAVAIGLALMPLAVKTSATPQPAL